MKAENIYDNVLITWEDNKLTNIFSMIGEPIQEMVVPKDNLRLDVVISYKKTSLRSIVEYLLDTLDISTNKSKLDYIISLISYIVMYALSPKDSAIIFFEKDEFREIDSLFETKHGEKFIRKENIKDVPHVTPVINTLIRNKLLEEDSDKYYVVGHILKNLRINLE